MTLPLLISVPHAGLTVPAELADLNLLTPQQIAEDGDEGASEVYDLAGDVRVYVTTDIARAFVDCNRPEDDRRADGIVKTHTCWNVPVYRNPLPEPLVQTLLERYYRPYHQRLTDGARHAILGLDCHTMAAYGPPIGPGAGEKRPAICVSNADGTCSDEIVQLLVKTLELEFRHPVTINDPFRGGFIIRHHSSGMPWVQIEMSRAPFYSSVEKRERFRRALETLVQYLEH